MAGVEAGPYGEIMRDKRARWEARGDCRDCGVRVRIVSRTGSYRSVAHDAGAGVPVGRLVPEERNGGRGEAMIQALGVVLLLAGVAGIFFGLGGLDGGGDMDTRFLVAGGAAGIVGGCCPA